MPRREMTDKAAMLRNFLDAALQDYLSASTLDQAFAGQLCRLLAGDIPVDEVQLQAVAALYADCLRKWPEPLPANNGAERTSHPAAKKRPVGYITKRPSSPAEQARQKRLREQERIRSAWLRPVSGAGTRDPELERLLHTFAPFQYLIEQVLPAYVTDMTRLSPRERLQTFIALVRERGDALTEKIKHSLLRCAQALRVEHTELRDPILERGHGPRVETDKLIEGGHTMPELTEEQKKLALKLRYALDDFGESWKALDGLCPGVKPVGLMPNIIGLMRSEHSDVFCRANDGDVQSLLAGLNGALRLGDEPGRYAELLRPINPNLGALKVENTLSQDRLNDINKVLNDIRRARGDSSQTVARIASSLRSQLFGLVGVSPVRDDGDQHQAVATALAALCAREGVAKESLAPQIKTALDGLIKAQGWARQSTHDAELNKHINTLLNVLVMRFALNLEVGAAGGTLNITLLQADTPIFALNHPKLTDSSPVNARAEQAKERLQFTLNMLDRVKKLKDALKAKLGDNPDKDALTAALHANDADLDANAQAMRGEIITQLCAVVDPEETRKIDAINSAAQAYRDTKYSNADAETCSTPDYKVFAAAKAYYFNIFAHSVNNERPDLASTAPGDEAKLTLFGELDAELIKFLTAVDCFELPAMVGSDKVPLQISQQESPELFQELGQLRDSMFALFTKIQPVAGDDDTVDAGRPMFDADGRMDTDVFEAKCACLYKHQQAGKKLLSTSEIDVASATTLTTSALKVDYTVESKVPNDQVKDADAAALYSGPTIDAFFARFTDTNADNRSANGVWQEVIRMSPPVRYNCIQRLNLDIKKWNELRATEKLPPVPVITEAMIAAVAKAQAGSATDATENKQINTLYAIIDAYRVHCKQAKYSDKCRRRQQLAVRPKVSRVMKSLDERTKQKLTHSVLRSLTGGVTVQLEKNAINVAIDHMLNALQLLDEDSVSYGTRPEHFTIIIGKAAPNSVTGMDALVSRLRAIRTSKNTSYNLDQAKELLSIISDLQKQHAVLQAHQNPLAKEAADHLALDRESVLVKLMQVVHAELSKNKTYKDDKQPDCVIEALAVFSDLKKIPALDGGKVTAAGQLLKGDTPDLPGFVKAVLDLDGLDKVSDDLQVKILKLWQSVLKLKGDKTVSKTLTLASAEKTVLENCDTVVKDLDDATIGKKDIAQNLIGAVKVQTVRSVQKKADSHVQLFDRQQQKALDDKLSKTVYDVSVSLNLVHGHTAFGLKNLLQGELKDAAASPQDVFALGGEPIDAISKRLGDIQALIAKEEDLEQDPHSNRRGNTTQMRAAVTNLLYRYYRCLAEGEAFLEEVRSLGDDIKVADKVRELNAEITDCRGRLTAASKAGKAAEERACQAELSVLQKRKAICEQVLASGDPHRSSNDNLGLADVESKNPADIQAHITGAVDPAIAAIIAVAPGKDEARLGDSEKKDLLDLRRKKAALERIKANKEGKSVSAQPVLDIDKFTKKTAKHRATLNAYMLKAGCIAPSLLEIQFDCKGLKEAIKKLKVTDKSVASAYATQNASFDELALRAEAFEKALHELQGLLSDPNKKGGFRSHAQALEDKLKTFRQAGKAYMDKAKAIGLKGGQIADFEQRVVDPVLSCFDGVESCLPSEIDAYVAQESSSPQLRQQGTSQADKYTADKIKQQAAASVSSAPPSSSAANKLSMATTKVLEGWRLLSGHTTSDTLPSLSSRLGVASELTKQRRAKILNDLNTLINSDDEGAKDNAAHNLACFCENGYYPDEAKGRVDKLTQKVGWHSSSESSGLRAYLRYFVKSVKDSATNGRSNDSQLTQAYFKDDFVTHLRQAAALSKDPGNQIARTLNLGADKKASSMRNSQLTKLSWLNDGDRDPRARSSQATAEAIGLPFASRFRPGG